MNSKNKKQLEQNLIILKYLKPDVLAFTGAIFVAYQMNLIGLTLAQVMIAQSVAAVTIFLCEVPSGIISDILNRKSIFIGAEICYLLSILVLAFAQNFHHILLMEVLFGIAYATISGTDSAILYETLKDLGREEEYTKHQGNFVSFFLLTTGFAHIASGFAGEIDLRIPVIACIPISVVQVVISFFLKEPLRSKTTGRSSSISHILDSFTWLYKYRLIFGFILFGVFVGVGRKIVLHTFNPYFDHLNIPVLYWGTLLALFNLAASFATKHSHDVRNRFGDQSIVYFLLIAQLIVFYLMSNAHFQIAFIWPVIHFAIWPVSTVIISSVLNEKSNRERRATVLSLASFHNQSAQIILLPFLGYIADLYSLSCMYLLMAILSLSTGIIIFYMIRR